MAWGGTGRVWWRAPWRALVALAVFALVASGVGVWPSVEPAVSSAQPEDAPVAGTDDKKSEPVPDACAESRCADGAKGGDAPEGGDAPDAGDAPGADEASCGRTFTYQDGDATRTVTLCDEIPEGGGDPDDWRGGRGAQSATGCASQSSDAHELLFRAESGVEMALGHSVVLVLDPGWGDLEVRRFLARNRIPFGCASPLSWIDNGFAIATGPGIAALQLANTLAGQTGVVLSSPNWASEFEVKAESDPPTRLSAPTITAVYPSDRSMTVTWTPPDDIT